MHWLNEQNYFGKEQNEEFFFDRFLFGLSLEKFRKIDFGEFIFL